MKRNFLSYLLLFVVAFSACKKDDGEDVNPQSPQESSSNLLSDAPNGWVLKDATVSFSYDFEYNGQTQSIDSSYSATENESACHDDHVYYFLKTGILEFQPGETFCGDTATTNDQTTWEVKDNQLTIIGKNAGGLVDNYYTSETVSLGDTAVFDILHLDESAFDIKYTLPYSELYSKTGVDESMLDFPGVKFTGDLNITFHWKRK